jgi:hypothetical protein
MRDGSGQDEPQADDSRCRVLAALAARPRIAIVGNAPGRAGDGRAIDAADAVVRFNNAAGFGGAAGGRLTHLALVNRGGQAREWARDAGFCARPAVRAARAVLLAFPPLPGDLRDAAGERVCWTAPLRARLDALGTPVASLPEALHAEGRRRLAPAAGGAPNPSTGFLVTFAVLRARRARTRPVEVYGFGFAGWPGHPWAAERGWFEAQAAAGRLVLHDPGA